VSDGHIAFSFKNATDLTGAANNNDTLTVETGGALSGVFDGGAGGYDSLVFNNGPHQTASYAPSGAQSGKVTLDGQGLAFTNLEPVSLGVVSSVVLDAQVSPGPLAATLDATGGNGFTLSGGFEKLNFTADQNASSLEIKVGSANPGDTLTVDAIGSPPLEMSR
jgi:hypothetical protein